MLLTNVSSGFCHVVFSKSISVKKLFASAKLKTKTTSLFYGIKSFGKYSRKYFTRRTLNETNSFLLFFTIYRFKKISREILLYSFIQIFEVQNVYKTTMINFRVYDVMLDAPENSFLCNLIYSNPYDMTS